MNGVNVGKSSECGSSYQNSRGRDGGMDAESALTKSSAWSPKHRKTCIFISAVAL